MTLTEFAHCTVPAPPLVASVSTDGTSTVVILREEADLFTLPVVVDVLARVIADSDGPLTVQGGGPGPRAARRRPSDRARPDDHRMTANLLLPPCRRGRQQHERSDHSLFGSKATTISRPVPAGRAIRKKEAQWASS